MGTYFDISHTPEECKKLYESNDDFKAYIDRYIRMRGKTKEQAFRDKVIREDVASMYEQQNTKED